MKKLMILCCLLTAFAVSQGQTYLLSKIVQDYSTPGHHGLNLKKFGYAYIGLGVAVPSEDSYQDILIYRSLAANLGYRNKLKFCNFFSGGLDINLGVKKFGFNVSDYPNTSDLKQKSEKHNLWSLGLGIYTRFNIGRRGNYMGNYLDLGIRGDWYYSGCHIDVFEKESGLKIKNIYRRTNFFEPFNYSLIGRIGINRFVIFGEYRMLNLMKETTATNVRDMPPITVGIEIGLF